MDERSDLGLPLDPRVDALPGSSRERRQAYDGKPVCWRWGEPLAKGMNNYALDIVAASGDVSLEFPSVYASL